VNYNSASDKLVSGGCDGDIKIWDATKGEFRFSALLASNFIDDVDV
jgi:WD40 repeat protein